jgi:hypothetical protein
VRSGQCPYLDDATEAALAAAREAGVAAQVVELATAQQVQHSAPSAYGVFGVVYDGRLLTYRPCGKKEIIGLFCNKSLVTPGKGTC